MLQRFPAPFTTPILQHTQQLLSLEVLAGIGAEGKVRRLGGGQKRELEVRRPGCPLGGALQGCEWGLRTWGRERHRGTEGGTTASGAGNEGGTRRGITGAVLRHRMLPFLISERFWRNKGEKKGSQDWLIRVVNEGGFGTQ